MIGCPIRPPPAGVLARNFNPGKNHHEMTALETKGMVRMEDYEKSVRRQLGRYLFCCQPARFRGLTGVGYLRARSVAAEGMIIGRDRTVD